jgi:hypothetical protein
MTFARVGAVVAMRVEDYYPKGKRWWEKGGKRHEMRPHSCRRETPLFRSAAAVPVTLTGKPMNRVDVWRMIQRRAAELGMRMRIGWHTFRGKRPAHESPRTTKLYDRTGDEITSITGASPATPASQE